MLYRVINLEDLVSLYRRNGRLQQWMM